jgi:signal transduction histidine kinase
MNLIGKFIIFFLLTSFFPSLILGFFLYSEISQNLNERFANLLNSAHMLVYQHYVNDLKNIQLINNQAASLLISEAFQNYLNTKKPERLEEVLNKLQKTRNLNIVALLDSNKKVIASTDTFEITNKTDLNRLIDLSLSGENIYSTENLKLGDSKENDTLMYIAVSPLYADEKRQNLLGILLIGQSVKDSSSFNEIGYEFTGLSIELLNDNKTKNLKKKRLAQGDIKPLFNYFNEPVGYLQIHLSRELEENFQTKNTWVLIIYLFLISLALLIMAYWFNNRFIVPIGLVANACDDLSQNNLDVEINVPHSSSFEIKRIINSFNHMVGQLKEDEKMRTNFISTLSHDLKTPLLAQARVFDLLKDFQTSSQNQFIKLIKALIANNTHLLQMVNLILDTYRYQEGQMQIQYQEINLFKLIKNCLLKLNPLAEAKQIIIKNTINQKSMPKLSGDEAQLERVFINIIGNAIENIQNNGQIELKATILEDTESLEIIISDNGPGMEEEVQKHLFERYYTHSRTKGKIGFGLGLYICDTIIKSHKGEITVQSELGKGTLFIIHLPY